MSRIGKLPIKVPTNVNILLENENICVKGPTGELTQKIPKELSIIFDQDKLKIVKLEETRLARQKYGLVRSLIMNMVLGVNKKFEKKLQMVGVGYKALVQGDKLILNVGFTHQITFLIPKGMDILVEANTNLTIRGANKEIVGLLASKIRATRPPEPYKGKGVKYNDEVILRKAGKSGKK
jgi:large subunit ribosomal protein L6